MVLGSFGVLLLRLDLVQPGSWIVGGAAGDAAGGALQKVEAVQEVKTAQEA
jgi:hypothetical protein